MNDLVIVAYRPKPDCEAHLLELLKDHVPFLRRLGFATERPSYLMQSKDGTFVEVFEWKEGAVAKAHEHPEVLAKWDQYEKVCDYTSLKDLLEAQDLFATFKPIDPPL